MKTATEAAVVVAREKRIQRDLAQLRPIASPQVRQGGWQRGSGVHPRPEPGEIEDITKGQVSAPRMAFQFLERTQCQSYSFSKN